MGKIRLGLIGDHIAASKALRPARRAFIRARTRT